MYIDDHNGKKIVKIEKYETSVYIKFDDGSEMVISSNGTEDHWVEVE